MTSWRSERPLCRSNKRSSRQSLKITPWLALWRKTWSCSITVLKLSSCKHKLRSSTSNLTFAEWRWISSTRALLVMSVCKDSRIRKWFWTRPSCSTRSPALRHFSKTTGCWRSSTLLCNKNTHVCRVILTPYSWMLATRTSNCCNKSTVCGWKMRFWRPKTKNLSNSFSRTIALVISS